MYVRPPISKNLCTRLLLMSLSAVTPVVQLLQIQEIHAGRIYKYLWKMGGVLTIYSKGFKYFIPHASVQKCSNSIEIYDILLAID